MATQGHPGFRSSRRSDAFADLRASRGRRIAGLASTSTDQDGPELDRAHAWPIRPLYRLRVDEMLVMTWRTRAGSLAIVRQSGAAPG